ncbi:MAG: SDR family oxidoreductase [Azoarcus sp.]|jgi:acyl transferase domain-containing protein/acyl carrier protein|nr:SDR family oxidoreductase [Azoarcus sp.]
MRADEAAMPEDGIDIAIVGMAGRFPDADNVDALWRNIRDGIESVSQLSDTQLRERGVPQAMLDDPAYVKAGVQFSGFDQFDASFFGYSPREAEQLDPQHRLLLECAWEALEAAGYDVDRIDCPVGVYVGEGPNLYLMRHLLPRLDWQQGSGIAELMSLMNGNSMAALSTQIAYKLNLRGPAMTVHTACSTSLVAVHMTCQSLLNHECDMGLAGGVWLNLLQDCGYLYQQGAILSSDGHCRAFDARADGTVLGSGAGIVVLKRLDDAVRDGDFIHAVIKGTAANNDGANKAGYTAPSVQAQAEVIETAHIVAGVTADTIGYVEAHGTGTTLGDPIEVAALTQAFRASTARTGHCALGSVKTNIGHLDAASGIAGLIKTAMALRHGILPPSLNFSAPNPQIDFHDSPFYVNTTAKAWSKGDAPKRAGVSSFGIGGTNVHAVLEEAPRLPVSEEIKSSGDHWYVLPVSAASVPALKDAVERLAEHLRVHPEQALADVAHTLQMGRRAFPFRTAVAAENHADATQALEQPGVTERAKPAPESSPEVVFLFPGASSQHVCMGAALYEAYPVFRAEVDHCVDFLRREYGIDLRKIIFPAPDDGEAGNQALARMEYGQSALAVISHATARLWMSLGVRPAAMLGHSVGEYVAACMAGVFSVEDMLRVVVERARLQQKQGVGAMTSVLLSEAQLQPFLGDGCELAAVNGEQMSVLSGPVERIEALEQALTAQGHVPRRLHVTVAAHSAMTEPIMAALEEVLASVPRQAPRIPFVSNVTGASITAGQAMSPAYWVKHLRSTVRFLEGLDTLLAVPGRVALEVGPSDALTSVARQHALAVSSAGIVSSQAHARQHEQNARQFAQAAGRLWSMGVALDWAALDGDRSRRARVPLPAYPFQHRSYWLSAMDGRAAHDSGPDGRRPLAEWFHVPVWRRVAPLTTGGVVTAQGCSLVLRNASPLASSISAWLEGHSDDPVVNVSIGPSFARLGERYFQVRPAQKDDLMQVLKAVSADFGPVARVCHLWSLGRSEPARTLERSLASVMALAQALGAASLPGSGRAVSLVVVANGLEDVTGGEAVFPEKATLLGFCKVLSQELPALDCRLIDVPANTGSIESSAQAIRRIGIEMLSGTNEYVVAYRGMHRWLKHYESVARPVGPEQRLRKQGVYLITGGLGGLGLTFARHLAEKWQARLILLTHSPFPQRAQWNALLADSNGDDGIRVRLRQIMRLESFGAEALVAEADVTDANELRRTVEAARERFGALHGVIHAAGRAGGGFIMLRDRMAAGKVLAPKLEGTRNLLAAIDGRPLDFVLLCSSLTAIVGGLGQADYGAANSGMDAIAVQAASDYPWPVISVNWDVWRNLGMATGQHLPDDLGIEAEQGGELLERVLAGAATPQLIVSSVSLERQAAYVQSTELADRIQVDPAPKTQRHPRPSLQVEYVAPSDELEQKLVDLWSDLLGVSPVGVDDNLFELGGDSLLAVQIVSRVRASLRVDFPIAEVMRLPTPRNVARLLRTGDEAASHKPMVFGQSAGPKDGLLPLSYAQQRLWFMWKMNPEGTSLNVGRAFRIEGPLDVAAVRDAVQRLVVRHAILRTVFREDGGVASQCVLPELAIDVPVTDLAPGVAAQAETLDAHLRGRVQAPFDLESGPLLRVEVIRTGDAVQYLLIIMHHVLTDGWSVSLLMREFALLYAAACRGETAQLPPLQYSYADFAIAQRQWLEDGEMARQTEYWQRQLRGYEPLMLPPDKSVPESRRYPVALMRFPLERALCDRLKEVVRERSLTPYVFLLGVTSLVLSERARKHRFYVGADMANRNRAETEGMVGFFVNLVAIRVDCAVPQDMSQLLAQLQKTVGEAAGHQDLPFDRLVEAMGKRERAGRAPLFQIKVLYREDGGGRFSLPGLDVSEHLMDPNEAELDLIVNFLATGQEMRAEIAYDKELYTAEAIEGIHRELLAALADCLADPELGLATLRERLAALRDSAKARKSAERADRMAAMRTGLRSRVAAAGR